MSGSRPLLVLILGAMLFAGCHPSGSSISGQVRYSQLWGRSGELWRVDGRLPDFSFAGYAMGDRPIPRPPVSVDVTAFGAQGDGVSDDSEAFLAAIASVRSGTVWIPEGRYLLSRVLRIDRPGVVLRGAGQGRTTLYFPSPLIVVLGPPSPPRSPGDWSFSGGLIWLHGVDRGVKIADIVAPARRGDSRLTLSTTEGLRPGQTVRVVLHADKNGSLWEHLHSREVAPAPEAVAWAGGRLVDLATRIVSIEGDRIVIDRPLRVAVDSAWMPQVFSHEPTLTEVGVEDLTIEFPASTYGEHLSEKGYNGIFLEGVHQFWIRDVEILNADSGIVSDGISRFGTITGVRLANDGRGGTVNGHHGISLEGPQDMLVTGFRIETRFRHDLTVDGFSTGNVFSRGRGVDLSFDHHTAAPYENLFSDIDAGAGDRLWYSGGPIEGWGPHSAARETFWNIRTSGVPERPPDWPELTIIGMNRLARSDHEDHWIEAIEPADLLPQDLHRAQWDRRKAQRSERGRHGAEP